jgi:hypothetical protein
MPPEVLDRLFNLGIVGVVFVLVLLGLLAPKWIIDYLLAQIKFKDEIIAKQAAAIERIADKLEAKL